MLGIHQNDDMLIGCACQHVVQPFQMQCGQIAVAIERVEVGAEDCALPDAVLRDIDSAVGGGGEEEPDIEVPDLDDLTDTQVMNLTDTQIMDFSETQQLEIKKRKRKRKRKAKES